MCEWGASPLPCPEAGARALPLVSISVSESFPSDQGSRGKCCPGKSQEAGSGGAGGVAWQLGAFRGTMGPASGQDQKKNKKTEEVASLAALSSWVCTGGGIWKLPSGIATAAPFQ